VQPSTQHQKLKIRNTQIEDTKNTSDEAATHGRQLTLRTKGNEQERVCSDWNLQTTLKSAAKTDKATGLEKNGAIQTELNGRSERSDREKQQS
jgi:hypothetical protein